MQIGEITPELTKKFNLGVHEGVVVLDTAPRGPAEDAGIRPGDVIMKVGEQDMKGPGQLLSLIKSLEPGTVVEVLVARGNKKAFATVTIGDVKSPEFREYLRHLGFVRFDELGITGQNIGGGGIGVAEADPNGPAATAGLKPGDVIVEVATKRVSNIEEFGAALANLPKGKTALFTVRRGNANSTVIMEWPGR